MLSDNIRIRRPRLDDVAGIVRAHSEAIRAKAAAHYSAEQIASWTRANSVETLEERLERERKTLAEGKVIAFVAELNGNIIGFSMLVPDKNELRAVYVAPGEWRGVGGLLLERIEEEARKLKVSYLECDASLNAENFYLKHDYEVVERTVHVLHDGSEVACVKMRKQL